MKDELTDEQIAALLALMGVARGISNTELEELAGFRIAGELRRTLNERHLVTSTREGNEPYVHGLTDAGWKRCEAELAGGLLRPSKHLAGAFHLVLDGVGRLLERENKLLTDVFRAEGAPPATRYQHLTRFDPTRNGWSGG